ncbi:MAG: undecaprenyl-diphosphate phosphatase [Phycisphaerae bacterium]|nr:undecaprenyl-diphosphate phosphatase [Phycisphaerae bacterium]MDW8262183.1 undecaprenyl-diphosphate phosphatase [Phycisphaerales bacterium]
MTELWIAILLGVIEGVTEFLPISSTGHLLLAKHWLEGIADLESDFWTRFAVFIQIGAILAVVVYFRERIRSLLFNHSSRGKRGSASAPEPATAQEPFSALGSGKNRQSEGPAAGAASAVATEDRTTHLQDPIRAHPILLLAVATVPVLVVGFLLHDIVERYLETPRIIAAALLIGGVLMIVIEKLRKTVRAETVEDVTLGQALFIGCVQVLSAVFPGTSRSAATIMGGLLAGLSRPAAAEFSFFLAIPSMFAACSFSLIKMVQAGRGLTLQQALLLAVGTLTSYLVAWGVIAAFMSYIRRYSFVPFAVYRIFLGLVVLWLVRHTA